jgi:hypothetical protein
MDKSHDHTNFGPQIPFSGSRGLFLLFWPLKVHMFFIHIKFPIDWMGHEYFNPQMHKLLILLQKKHFVYHFCMIYVKKNNSHRQQALVLWLWPEHSKLCCKKNSKKDFFFVFYILCGALSWSNLKDLSILWTIVFFFGLLQLNKIYFKNQIDILSFTTSLTNL